MKECTSRLRGQKWNALEQPGPQQYWPNLLDARMPAATFFPEAVHRVARLWLLCRGCALPTSRGGCYGSHNGNTVTDGFGKNDIWRRALRELSLLTHAEVSELCLMLSLKGKNMETLNTRELWSIRDPGCWMEHGSSGALHRLTCS